MALSLTLKQEAFCQAYLERKNASAAYRHAYDAENMLPTTINRKAHSLLHQDKIKARLEILQKYHQKKHEITMENLITELEQARKMAMEDKKSASAAVSAIMGKAKLLGLDVQKHEITGKNGNPLNINLSQMTDAELYQIATGGRKNNP